MAPLSRCPFCASDKVYRLLNTLRCKRCKNIWKEGEDPDPSAVYGSPVTSSGTRKRTDSLKTKMEKKLEEYLARSGGKFCIDTMTWQAGDISGELFRRYLKQCVNNRSLAEKKDRYRRTWYCRP